MDDPAADTPQSQPDPTDVGWIIHALAQAGDEASYMDLLSTHPEILSDEVIARIDEIASSLDFGAVFELPRGLLIGSRTDPHAAWLEYQRDTRAFELRAERLRPLLDTIEEALVAGNYEVALELTDNARPAFAEAGLVYLIGRLHAQRGRAYVQMSSGDLRDNADRALLELRAALALPADPVDQVHDLMNLGLVFRKRLNGDRSENLESAVAALQDAVELALQVGIPELIAITRTNLATAILNREVGEIGANRRRAAELCRLALEYRSPDRNATDWVYSQFTLADSLDGLLLLGQASVEEVGATYAEILSVQQLESEAPWAYAVAHYGLGRLALRVAASLRDQLEAPEPLPEHVHSQFLEARSHLEAAVNFGPGTPETIYGRALSDLARVSAHLGDLHQAIEYGERAMELLTPVTDPRECVDIGFALGLWLADTDRWLEAADVYKLAIEASEMNLHARVFLEGREAEIKRAGRLHRWASFALAKAGRAEDAALILETGRSRELRRRLELSDDTIAKLRELPEALSAEYDRAVRDLAASPLGTDSSQASEHLQRVLHEIRYIPGFQDFGAAVSPADLFDGVEEGWPLLYVNPAPRGVCILRVDRVEGSNVIDSLLLDEPGSQEVLFRLLAGVRSPQREDWGEGFVSYMAEASGFAGVEGERLGEALDRVMPWFGQAIARPLWAFANRPGLHGLTLVLCGPLTLLPLNACTWEERDELECLLDHIPVRFAPSALLAGVTIRRASNPQLGARTFLGLGDPQRGDPVRELPAAEPELRSVIDLFKNSVVVVGEGKEATSALLREHAAEATHIHLACHGQGGLTNIEDAEISLADACMAAQDLAALPLSRAPLVVLSACQTAVPEFQDLPDEALSVGTAFLAAGASCVIASLWSVDDLATAMLMVRMYEELVLGDQSAPEALRRAQIWLRDLDEAGERLFLERNVALGNEWMRRQRTGRSIGATRANAKPDERPFNHARFWAPFIASGS